MPIRPATMVVLSELMIFQTILLIAMEMYSVKWFFKPHSDGNGYKFVIYKDNLLIHEMFEQLLPVVMGFAG